MANTAKDRSSKTVERLLELPYALVSATEYRPHKLQWQGRFCGADVPLPNTTPAITCVSPNKLACSAIPWSVSRIVYNSRV